MTDIWCIAFASDMPMVLHICSIGLDVLTMSSGEYTEPGPATV